MIRLYTAATPNGRKISIALEEIGAEYEVKKVDLGAGEQLAPEFLAVNPNGKIPALEDEGIVIWESAAILVYLAEKFQKLLPADPQGRIAAIQYACFQTGGIGPNLGRFAAQLRRPEAERNKEMLETFSNEVGRLIGVLDRILADGRPYLAGEYSIGDIMHYPWLQPMQSFKTPMLMERKRVVEWLERIAARPAVQRGMQIP